MRDNLALLGLVLVILYDVIDYLGLVLLLGIVTIFDVVELLATLLKPLVQIGYRQFELLIPHA